MPLLQVNMSKWTALTGCFLVLVFPLRVFGQVELIVSPVEEAAPAYVQALDRLAAKSGPPDSMDASLFGDALAATSVFSTANRPSKSPQPAPPYAFTLTFADSAAYRAAMRQWASRSDIAAVEPNASFGLHAPAPVIGQPGSDPQADSLTHLNVIRAREAWSGSTGSPDVRIGLVDTGLDLDHPDLRSQLWINPGEDLNGNGRVDRSDLNGVDDDQNGWVDDLHGYDFVDRPSVVEMGDFRGRDADPSADPDSPFSGHATAVAGAMSAARNNAEGITGVAPGSRLVPLRAFGGDGRGATDDIAAAIVYAVQQGVDVVNLSFGRDFASPLLEATIQYAVAQGTVVVASAGNNGGDDPHYPSDYPAVISVAWLNANGTDIAFRGEYGIGIDIGAPGTAIYTTLKPPLDADGATQNIYGRQSGSSMAAPLVTGTVALLRSIDPSLSPSTVRSILTASAHDIGAPGWDHRTASGRLDVASALARALPARTEITSPSHNQGTADPALPIIGTAIDPSFASYTVFYAAGTQDLDDLSAGWTRLTGPVERQVLNDTLAVLPAETLDEGAYTLRLVTTLRSGTQVEDRRRVYVDRSAPVIDPQLIDVGLLDGAYGVIVDVRSTDFTTARMRIRHGTSTYTVSSEVRNARHGLFWPDKRGRGGVADVHLTLRNASGLSARIDTVLQIPPWRANTALLNETSLQVPHGALLPQATDFDDDGLREVVFNQYERGALGDTLRALEWDGTTLSPLQALVANVIPRDVGDTNEDGRLELLTQVGGATLLLEQGPADAFPTQERFVDTTGLSRPSAVDAVWGGRLTDLDRDGQGEILAHNRTRWRVLEWNGTTYDEVARLVNPTGADGADPAVDANGFQQPLAVVKDFDGDGRTNVLVGDNDGDWIVYEATGNDRFETVWTHETDRIDGGARFASGDFDGDGNPDVVTYTQNLPILTADGAREPPIGVYYFWESQADDRFLLRQAIPVRGSNSSHGALTSADFDSDGQDEVAIVHPPNLYVLGVSSDNDWHVRYHRGIATAPDAGLRSASLVAADFTGNGAPELLAATADARLHLWQYQAPAEQQPPPRWTVARASSADAVRLAWRAPRADSVTAYAGPPGADVDPYATLSDSSLTVSTRVTQRYVLRAWYDGVASALTPARTVRPHAPAVVESVSYPSPRSVTLQFSEPIAPRLEAAQFRLDGGLQPASVLLQADGRQLVLQFDAPPTPREDILRWTDVTDIEDTPVGQTEAAVSFPEPDAASLIVESWRVEGRKRVVIHFNAPLDPQRARQASRYEITPYGSIARVDYAPEVPDRVTVMVRGAALGAVGANVSLRLSGLQSRDGASLSEAGSVLRLAEPAADLADVYAYPNPLHRHRHDADLTIAGLPAEATVRIFSADGVLVNELVETGRDGGLQWDLHDRNGRTVPSGVYLLHVESPGQDAVLRKVAIVR